MQTFLKTAAYCVSIEANRAGSPEIDTAKDFGCKIGGVDSPQPFAYYYPMEKKLVSFEQIEREHRQERTADSRRIALHQATPKQIQEENSWIPDSVEVRIPSLLSYAQEHYSY